MKRLFSAFLCIAMMLSLCACGDAVITSSKDVPKSTNAKHITLNGDSITADSGVKISGTTATITAAGNYAVSGKLADGSIVINTGDEKSKVSLILENCDITNLTGAAIVVERAEKVKIILPKDSVNRLCSGNEEYKHNAYSEGAVIDANDDIKLEGEGKLVINGYINNGISCKNDVDINGGELVIYAVNNAIKGNDSVEVNAGVLELHSGNDGIKSTTADKAGKGFVNISGGCIDIISQGDGISAETELNISAGVLCIEAEGEPQYASSKGMKANGSISISGGNTEIKSKDNAVSCEGNISFTGGVLSIESAADGIRCKGTDNTLKLEGGCLEISSLKKCFDVDGTLEARSGAVTALGNYKRLPDYNGLKVNSQTGKAGEKHENLIAKFDFNTVITN